MKNLNLVGLVIILMTVLSLQTYAQRTQVDPAWETGSIENQIDFLIKSSNNYQDYKVIRKAAIFQLKSNIVDSLNSIKNSLSESQFRVKEQDVNIKGLNTQLSNLQEQLDQTISEKESISFMGIQMNKTAYQALMWAIIAGLIGLLSLFIFRFRQANVDTEQASKDFKELQVEFENHRKRSLEREQKAMRKLQDVINQNADS